ncbi:AIR synthase [Anoxybacter fermentans]|uniref:AIR synthase n=1 Tax=Anoxybacter fermentans TaxID=1323375 RepID=A0A3S9T1R8_9FIRM|nr:AIR synthase family protein [Anoxybacter fermentans]AZR74556.1 AIR synthase [Anoxybacter fermentans]
MKVGKLIPDKLNDLILNQISSRRSDVLVHPRIGEDCAVIDFGEVVCVISTDPITGASKGMGRLAVHISCNDLAANGAEPVGVQLVLLLPEDITEERIKEIMQEVDYGAAELGIEVLGGHTEITSLVSKPIIVATAIGKARKGQYVTSSGAKPGDDIIITKGAGIEGTAILANDCVEYLLSKGVKDETIKSARKFMDEISVLKEGLLAARMGATAMHDVTEGGIYGALYELANASEVGFDLFADQVYIRPETREICDALQIDPLGLISSGTMLITIPDGDKLLAALKEKGIPACKIGKITESGQTLWVNGEKRKFVLPPRDELWRILEEI